MGTLYPQMMLLEETPTLLFLDMSSSTSSWRVQELDGETGEVRRNGMVQGDDSETPLLLVGEDGPYVEWPRGTVRKSIVWERQE